MPYTPPSSRSPTTSSPNSPILSRNQSFDQHSPNGRPGLPRSRSATYLQQHRRTPSISDKNSHREELHHGELAPIDPRQLIDNGHHHIGHAIRIVTSHATDHAESLTVPDLTQDSTVSPSEASDEEDRGRGRQVELLAEHLQQKMVRPNRGVSPQWQDDMQSTDSKPIRSISPGLTPEAIKISHSRSSSDVHFSTIADIVPSQAASSEEDSDDDLLMKPSLVRKKSGELVKPALRATSRRRRPLSMPGTPTYSKAVHFNEDIAHVRHFLQTEKPAAVSAGSSPVESLFDSESEYPFGYGEVKRTKEIEWEIRTANFPRDSIDRQYQPVRVEKIYLSSDNKTLIGNVACANIAFQKWVVARFTLDYWKTTSEVVCEFNNDVRKKHLNDGYDRFNFNIKLSDQANLETKTMLICVRYNVAGQEHWDNNNLMNYQVDFIKKMVPRKSKHGRVAGTTGSIPRSRHSPLARPRSFPAADDDFSSGFEFGSNATVLADPPAPALRLKNRQGSLYPTKQKRGQGQQSGGAFSTRYDFGTSLSASLANAQVPHKSQSTGDKEWVKSGDYFSKPVKMSAPAVQPVDSAGATPANMTSSRPELGSREYHDLIKKFCYFGSKAPTPDNVTPAPADELKVEDSDVSALNSGESSPPSPRPAVQYDGAQDSIRSSRSSTPTPNSFHTTSPRLLAQYRSPSPALHELPFQVLAQ
ncbi:carbohydrate-binding module family 21 protein [Venturia nashicola]|uniref:Carbohydrate-binding module family 21 protein n=1 Tax=Venturia nashicola TaxID=86259 RepID=A0A4Z1NVE8_9PEZI|nr:carbohydrate-binding module family 21 protein [Venturia nashicola]TLD21002.1 carbohydrate-binding module family 21 protein [Venturia nashicola]